MATRRHAVVLLVLCAVLWSTGASSSNGCQGRRLLLPGCAVPSRPWSCSWRSGVARPLVVVAWERCTGGRRLDAGFCHRHQADHRRERDLPRVYRAAVRGAAEPLGAPRAHPPRGLADPPARPAWAGLFLCGAVDLGGVGRESVRPGSGLATAWLVVCLRKATAAPLPILVLANLLVALAGLPFLEGATLAPVHWGSSSSRAWGNSGSRPSSTGGRCRTYEPSRRS